MSLPPRRREPPAVDNPRRVVARPRRSTRKYRIRKIWRLELACVHVAYAVAGEPCTKGLARFCYICDRYVLIVDELESTFKTSDKASRIPIKHHELE